MSSPARTWRGVASRWYIAAPLALLLILVLGCKAPASTPARLASQAETYTYPPRPTVPASPFKVFHQDEDTYTLTTKPDATDAEISAILWQFRDATLAHNFAALHLNQKFIDTRKPSIWFHIYRGPKCANEKFVQGKYPCGAKYNGAGDYTLGAYNNPDWNDAVLHTADGKETHLWDPDAPTKR